jgi:hypothetical protein
LSSSTGRTASTGLTFCAFGKRFERESKEKPGALTLASLHLGWPP